ncbi:hypothetical protein H0H93_008842, partial [Arthromyces matolae]
ALQPLLSTLLESLPSDHVEQSALNDSVRKAIEESKKYSVAESIRRSQWELLLKNEVFDLAVRLLSLAVNGSLTQATTVQMTEGKALKENKDAYYDKLKFLQDLLETQTIASCSHIFAWIEARTVRLTVDLKPQKGKALILLRSLNDLLRRLSKTGATTVFCGRILTFLSGVFPLGERSGVNLRGEYGPVWEGVVELGKKSSKSSPDAEEAPSGDAMEVDVSNEKKASQAIAEKKEEFYNTFWGLQLPFSKPSLFANAETFLQFKESVNKVLPVIKEATAKERLMMGSRANSTTLPALKRKREPEVEELNSTNQDYFFAKFLTSPDLIELEAHTHFRRQFLFQLLILLHHLSTFTKAAKAEWMAPNNRALQMDFTLEPTDAQWIQETINRAMEELRQTTPNGRAFSEAVSVILEREKNWVRWKNHLCAPFDKAPARFTIEEGKVGTLFEATADERAKMREPPEDYPWSHGSEALTEIWEMGCRGLTDLENYFQPGDVKDFLKKIKMEDQRIDLRKKFLMKKLEAQQRLSAPKKEATPVPLEAPVKTEEPSKPSTPVPPSSLSVPSATNSPLHPSLPPKPGSSPIPTSTSQDVEMAEPPSKTAPALNPSAPSFVPSPSPAPTPAPEATPVEPKPLELPPDGQISKHEEASLTFITLLCFDHSKQRWAWIALRTARDQHLQHFGKIGTGDIEMLSKEIDKERIQKEKGEDVKNEEGKDDVKGEDGASVCDGKEDSATEVPAGLEAEDIKMTDAMPQALKVGQGSHVVYALQKTRRFKVISIDNGHNSYPVALKRVSELSKKELGTNPTQQEIESTEIDAYNCDLTRPEEIKAVFEKYGKGGIYGVIHIAAYKAVGESTEIPLTYYTNNVSATVYLLQIMADYDCYRFVYSSSATVYGTPPIIPIPETTRLQADSPYGKTKVMSETIVDDLCHSDKRWRAISLRYFNPAGAHPSGYIGEDPRGRPGNLLPLLAHMAVGRVKDSTLKVFGNDYPTPDGTCVRDYLHVMDLASGHLLALDALEGDAKIFGEGPNAYFKAYNLGRGQGYSVLQIVEAMREATGFDYKQEIIGRRRGDVPDLTADPALAEKELGFKAAQNLTTMCKDLWNWQTKNPQGYGGDQA